jgi:hypothetical protein
MEKLKDSFITKDNTHFKWKIGKIIASSLSGFLAGIIVVIILILAFFDISFKG